jgi:hypothetical protein
MRFDSKHTQYHKIGTNALRTRYHLFFLAGKDYFKNRINTKNILRLDSPFNKLKSFFRGLPFLNQSSIIHFSFLVYNLCNERTNIPCVFFSNSIKDFLGSLKEELLVIFFKFNNLLFHFNIESLNFVLSCFYSRFFLSRFVSMCNLWVICTISKKISEW